MTTEQQAARWENDPSLLPQSAERDRRAQEGAYRSIRDNNQAHLIRKDRRAAYEAWLKKNPKA